MQPIWVQETVSWWQSNSSRSSKDIPKVAQVRPINNEKKRHIAVRWILLQNLGRILLN